MKYLFNCLLLTVISFSSIFAQKLTTSSTYLKRTVNLKENIDHWKASVQSMQMTNPGGNSYNDFLITQKQIQSQKYPRKKSLKSISKSLNIPSFNIENGFEGNLYNNKVPNDNTLAISNDGIILAGINSSYIIYDTNNDSLLLSSTLNSMTLDFMNLRFVKKYDPKFIYDHN